MNEQTPQTQEKPLLLGWPVDNADFKVVQLETRKGLVMKLGDLDAFHRTILKNCLEELGINPVKDDAASERKRDFVPKLSGPDYKVVGMGQGGIYDFSSKEIHFCGRSMDYGLEVNREHLDQVMKANKPDWKYDMEEW